MSEAAPRPLRIPVPIGKLDPAWTLIVLIPLLVLAIDPPQAGDSLAFALRNLLWVAPFLLASIGIAAYAKASGADSMIARAFHGREAVMVVAAALMGALSPFCSCGVIPLIAALLAMGVPLGPVMAFWLASPIMDPSMFVLTWGVLGLDFAIGKTIAAVGLGLLGGYGVMALSRAGLLPDPLREGVGNGGCGGAKIRNPKEIVWRFWSEPARNETFARNALSNLLFLGKWLTLAYLLESLMLAYVPADLVVRAVGGEGMTPMLIAALVGVPAYLNGYAALPLVGGLVEQGMAPAAGMVFLIAGGVTSIPAAIAVWALARPPVFIVYIAFSLTGAILAGLGYGLFV